MNQPVFNQPVLNKPNFDESPLTWKIERVTRNTIELSWERRAGVVEYLLSLASGNPEVIYQGSNTTATHGSLKSSTDYSYFISGRSVDGKRTKPTLINARTAVRQAPVTPSYIRAVDKKEDSVLIIWDKGGVDGGVPSYHLTRDGETLDRPKNEEFRDSGPKPGREHVYCVHTVDDEYYESPAICIAVKFDGSIAPTDPTNLHVNGVHLEVKWTPVYDSSDKVFYTLYLGGDVVATTTDPKYVFTGLQPGQQYEIGVMASDESGNNSKVVTIHYPALGVPPQRK